ncbi:hypothetical protein U1Q18_035151 [Sarracenia purpurea var. burkii]
MLLYPTLLVSDIRVERGSWVPQSEVCPRPPPYSAVPVARSLPSAARTKGGEENGGLRPATLAVDRRIGGTRLR